jgi:hypothetical protein
MLALLQLVAEATMEDVEDSGVWSFSIPQH